MRYQPIFHTLNFTLHCARVLSNVVLTTVIEMFEILDGRVGKRSVECVKYVTRKMVSILQGERAHCLKYFVCTIRGLRYQKQNRMEEETEPQT